MKYTYLPVRPQMTICWPAEIFMVTLCRAIASGLDREVNVEYDLVRLWRLLVPGCHLVKLDYSS
jgi:hypothetical protein